MPICAGCGQDIRNDCPKILMTKEWHSCCFKCFVCNESLKVDESLKIYNGEVYCSRCFENLNKSKLHEDEFANLQTYCLGGCQNTNGTDAKENLCSYKFTSGIPRELANYFNRNPIGDRCSRIVCCANPKLWRGIKKSPSENAICSRKTKKQCRFCNDCEFFEPESICKGICLPCKRCGEKVYAVERILASTGVYHDSCFSCFCCGKPLDLRSSEESCGEVYCRKCYEIHFGFNNYRSRR